MDFEEFVQAQSQKFCWVGLLPESEEIDEAYAKTRSPKLIHRWLTEAKGYSPQEATLRRVAYHVRRNCACPP